MIDLLFVVMFQAAAGAPQTTAPTTPAGQTTASSDTGQTNQQSTSQQQDIGLRCQRQTTTGSIIGHRRCSTREQRREQEENAARDAEHLQRAHDVVQPGGP